MIVLVELMCKRGVGMIYLLAKEHQSGMPGIHKLKQNERG